MKKYGIALIASLIVVACLYFAIGRTATVPASNFSVVASGTANLASPTTVIASQPITPPVTVPQPVAPPIASPSAGSGS
jgi:hypothetical protein